MNQPMGPTAPAPPAPPAPLVPPPPVWGASAAPSPGPGSKLKPAVVIGIIVGVVALVGAGAALLSGSKDNETRAAVTATGPTVPLGAAVLDPSLGPQPAEPAVTVPLPGPGVEPVVTTPTAPPATAPAPAPPPAGNSIEVGAGVTVTPAAGWSTDKQEAGFVQLSRDDGGAQLFVSLYDASIGSTAAAAADAYLSSSIVGYVAELETTPFEGTGALNANVTDNGSFEYRGMVASQGGSAPIEGFVAVFVRSDGSVLVYEEMNDQGGYAEFQDDYRAMLNSIVPTL